MTAKILISLLLCSVWIEAGERMTPDEHRLIHPTNKKPSLQQKGRQKMHTLHKIDENEAKKIATKLCGFSPRLTLRHRGTLLFYRSTDTRCPLSINALDGTVIEVGP
ncbi:MAG: hypothetical protein B6D59_00550 [Campylobacteraceae bacterium 4484_4]|nr:MAG: hypothetical protein B6D59_00550 [Campylobacteraceae bacterium 4484_4]